MRHSVYPRRVLIFALAALLVLTSAALPGSRASAGGGGVVLYAKPGGALSGFCLTWGTACELRYVLATWGGAGDQIWVAKGIYKPTSGTDRGASFMLKSGVGIYGGFAGTETLFTQRNVNTNLATLSGDIGVVGVANDNSYQVVKAPSVTSAVLDGFQIVGGYANSTGIPLVANGAGMEIDGGSPTLRHLRFIKNFSSYDGGAMIIYTSTATLTDVSFEGNSSGEADGGGIYNFSSSPTLTNVTFSGNKAYHDGGGVYNASGSSPRLTNVTFSGNSAGRYGGGMFSTGNPTGPVLVNTTFSGNSANLGGAIFNETSAHSHIYDSIFWNNGLTGIRNGGWGTADIANSIVAGGCPAASTCSAVLNASPVLGALKNNGGFTKTMAIGAGSPAIDKGNNTTCAARDQRGVIRPQGPTCDMGAYEVKVLTFSSAAAYDGWVLESGKATNVGGSLNSTATTIRAGDDSANRRFRGFLSFSTATVPDGATIVLARVRVLKQGVLGNPFATQGKLVTDLAKPYFGAGPGLVVSDWQAAATVSPAGTFGSTPSGGWYQALLNSSGRANINKTGTTQLRLRFSSDTYNGAADYLSLYSGNYGTSSYRPKLILYYNP